jgi:hypothetical protein
MPFRQSARPASGAAVALDERGRLAPEVLRLPCEARGPCHAPPNAGPGQAPRRLRRDAPPPAYPRTDPPGAVPDSPSPSPASPRPTRPRPLGATSDVSCLRRQNRPTSSMPARVLPATLPLVSPVDFPAAPARRRQRQLRRRWSPSWRARRRLSPPRAFVQDRCGGARRGCGSAAGVTVCQSWATGAFSCAGRAL